MSTVVMASPAPHAPFAKRELGWQDFRADYSSSRPRAEPDKIALPPIQTIPELRVHLGAQERSKSSTTSPTVGVGALTPPEYVHSPSSKRRRLSYQDEMENERARQVPRLYDNPGRLPPQHPPHQQQVASSSVSPTVPASSAPSNWPTRTSTYPAPSAALPAMRSSPPPESDRRAPAEPRPQLPSLPPMNLDKGPAPTNGPPPARYGSRISEEYAPEAARMPPAIEPPQARQFSYAPPYQHASRSHPLPAGTVHHPYDRSPFSTAAPYPGPPAHPYHDYMRVGESGMGLGYGMPGMGIGMGVDCTKQRKRRGNLPKETTDKLRAWFVAHLHHPYPTEDEKQELMRQTGLQMNQISNWFINARRRALPQLLNDQRMADAKAAGQGNAMPSTERHEYGDRVKRESVPISDGSTIYDDDFNRRRGNLKRGSV